MAKTDLKSEELANIVWKPGQIAVSLDKVRIYVRSKAKNAVEWYYAAKAWKKRAAIIFRVGIILLTAAAGVLPMLNEIYQSREIEKQLRATRAAATSTPSTNSPSNSVVLTPSVVQPAAFQRLLNPL